MEEEQHLGEGMERAACRGRWRRRRRGGRPVGANEHGRGGGGRASSTSAWWARTRWARSTDAMGVEHGRGGAARWWWASSTDAVVRWASREHGFKFGKKKKEIEHRFLLQRGPTCKWV